MNEIVSALGSASIRIAVLIPLVWIALATFRRTSASTRHAVWVVTLVAAAMMPLIGGLIPGWRVPHTLPALDQRVEPAKPVVPTTIVYEGAPRPPVTITTNGTGKSLSTGLDWIQLAAWIWAMGVVATALVFIYGWISAKRLVSRAERASDSRILGAVSRGFQAAGFERKIDIRSTRESGVAFIFGAIRPSLVVPEAAKSWDDETLSLVIAHELSHLRRHDAVTQRLADVVCAAYWFHPAVWIAVSRVRQESELACDDDVLLKGNNAASYAELLLTLAQATKSVPHHVLAMARPSTLETRVVAALDKRRARRNRKVSGISMIAGVAMIAVTIGAAHPAVTGGLVATAPDHDLTAAPVIAAAPAANVPESSMPEESAPGIEAGSTLPSRFKVAARKGVCGNGIPDEITYSSRPMNSAECRGGMALITVTSRGGRLIDVHATMAAELLGDAPVVDARDAASELLSIIPSIDGDAAARSVQAAALIENGATAREVLSVAKNSSLEPKTRRMAVTWFGILGGDGATESLLAIAKDETAEASVREQALIALDLSINQLVDLFPLLGELKLKERIVNAVADSRDAGAKQKLTGLVRADRDESFKSKALDRLSR